MQMKMHMFGDGREGYRARKHLDAKSLVIIVAKIVLNNKQNKEEQKLGVWGVG